MAECPASEPAEPFQAYYTMSGDQELQTHARRMADFRAEARQAAWETYDAPRTRASDDVVSGHGEKLKEHRERLDQHKMYLMHIAQEADLQAQCEDQSTVPSINAYSKNIDRNDRVENVLIQKGKDYDKHIDGLREAKEKEEEVELLFSPRICEQSTRTAGNRGGKTHDRLIQWGKNNDQKKAAEASRIADAEEQRKKMELVAVEDPSHMTALPDGSKGMNRVQNVLGLSAKGMAIPGEHNPVINNRSARKTREYQDCLEWGEELKKHKEHIKESYEEMEIAALQDQPTISARSKKLAQKSRGEGAIEDSLLERGHQARQRFQKKAELVSAEECPHRPKITSYAASLERQGEVGERLYAKAFEYRAKRQELVESQMREIEDMARRGSGLGQYPHSPHTRDEYSHDSHCHDPVVPIEIDLARREQERQARRDEQAYARQEEEKLLHYPKINTMSDLIAQQLPEDSIERLLRPKKEYVYEQPLDTNLTFHPQINPRSAQIMADKAAKGEVVQDSGNRNEYLYSKDEEKKLKQEHARKIAEDRELEECTFAPRINRNSAAMAPSNTHSVVTRTTQWQKQRMARLRQQREEMELKEQEQCTFQPSIHSYKGVKKPRKPRAAAKKEQDDEQSHVARQARARKQKADQEAIPHASGQTWTNKLTQPKEFQFSHRIKVKALGQPINQTNAVKLASKENASAAPDYSRAGAGRICTATMSPEAAERAAERLNGDVTAVKLGGSVSAEWAARAAEKHAAEDSHSLAGMHSPRFWAGDALNSDVNGTSFPRSGNRGEEAFVERMKLARKEREAREMLSDNAGSGKQWTGKCTKPKEFNFSSSSVRVKALSQPVSPMTR